MLTIVVWARPAAAQRAWSVEVDNDFFNAPPLGHPTDADYSQGLRIRHRLPGSSPLGARLFGPAPPCRTGSRNDASLPCQSWSVQLEQAVYTPWVDRPTPSPGDRPYAGWLGVSLRSVHRKPGATRTLAVTAGLTGPASLGATLQRLFHQLIRNPPPVGWHNQLGTRIGLEADYEVTRGLVEPGREPGIRFSLVPSWGLTLGTIRTAARAGVRTMLEVGAPGAARWRETGGPPRGASAYLVGGLSGHAIVDDVFLDSPVADLPAVGHLPFVARAELGVGVRLRGVGLEYTVHRDTREYGTQPQPHTYATITLMR